jgi:hypothetical protein
MARVGRNDPCPCGSGKKYKRCCLQKREAQERARHSGNAAVGQALDWLRAQYDEAVEEALEDVFFGAREEDEERFDRLLELPEDLGEMMLINANEWLLAEAELRTESGFAPAIELVLGPGGPLMSPDQRRWLEEIGRRPLRLYEVQESLPDEGIRARDLLDPESESVWVTERLASRSLRTWDVFAARLIPWEDQWQLSGAIYPFERRDVPPLVEGLQAMVRKSRADKEEDLRFDLSQALIDTWLYRLTELPWKPKSLVDHSGEPILLTTHHYRVRDWERLAAALKAEDDVEGDRREGWVRLEPSEGTLTRSLLAINPGKGDRLEIFARTKLLADQGREWFDQVAGDAAEFVASEIVDPLSDSALDGAGERPPPPQTEIPPEEKTQILQQVFEEQYEDWPDEAIPMLDDKTPRQALTTKKGREQVVELLKLYENSEARSADHDGRQAVSFRFLWEALGLDREATLGER